ncbi:MAG: tRNA pseudouridine(38-40) synthase TruA [Puniceicoccales bacterium]
MTRWKAICSYDGTDFTGWQSQSTRDAVQDALENALGLVLRTSIRIQGAGRTDAGVHARGQCFHFDHDWKHSGEALVRAINTKLPGTLRLCSIEPVTADFHARFSARGKRYEYLLSANPPSPFTLRYRWHLPGAFDPEKVRPVLPSLAGTHDFTAFAGKVIEGENPVKTLRIPELIDEGQGNWILRVEGSGFLYRMVRSLAGTLARVASGKLPPERIAQLLAEKKRTPEVHTAPACGLFLDEVFYGEDFSG